MGRPKDDGQVGSKKGETLAGNTDLLLGGTGGKPIPYTYLLLGNRCIFRKTTELSKPGQAASMIKMTICYGIRCGMVRKCQ